MASELAARGEEVFLSGKWIAQTNVNEVLSGVSLAEATRKIHTLNTLADLTFHLNYYLEGLLQVFAGGKLEIRDEFSFNTPALHTESDWRMLRASLLENAGKFSQVISTFTQDDLAMPFAGGQYGSVKKNIDGTIEHAYYHLGQMVLIRKLIVAGL